MSPRKRRLGEKFRSLYLWHRYSGLIAALLVAWLAVTGILLNHTDDLELAEEYVGQEWLLSLYGIDPPRNLKGWKVGQRWLVEANGRIYLDNSIIATGNAVGAAATGFGFVIAFADRLQLYTVDAQRIETLPFTIATTPIDGLASSDDGLLIITGDATFRIDPAMTNFERMTETSDIAAMPSQSPPPDLERVIARHARKHTLSWERVLLDAHAGRIFGKAGGWLADVTGTLLLLLAVSGVLVWLQRRRRQERQ